MAAILTNGVLKIRTALHLSAAVGAGALPGLVAAIGTRALAPPSLPRPPSPTSHDLTPKLRATFPSFVTRYRAGLTPIT